MNKFEIVVSPGDEPIKMHCRHAEHSLVLSTDDDPFAQGSDHLFNTVLKAIELARNVDLSWIADRMPEPPFFPLLWPGTHYRLLTALVEVIQPSQVVEIGTLTGLSALALKASLPSTSSLHLFDIVEWSRFSDTHFREADFNNTTQHIADLSIYEAFLQYKELLRTTELFFIDAPKDGIFEPTFLRYLAEIDFPSPPIIVLDDIRLAGMIPTWREITHPKLDITSFGNWSGTGIVEWSNIERKEK
jgi:predicted O-methyltransferase YrrM